MDLLYRSETLTLTVRQTKRLDGTYTTLLMRVENLSWKCHPTKNKIYGLLKPISDTVTARRIQFAGHCHREKNEIISSLLLWKPKSIDKRGRKLTFPDVISRDTGVGRQDQGKVMQEREVCKEIVNSVSTAVSGYAGAILSGMHMVAAI